MLALFPELGLSAYSCDDLFHQRALLDGCRDGAGARSSRPRRVCRWSRWSALPLRSRSSAVQLRGGDVAADGFWAWCPRPICPITASSTRRGSSLRARSRVARRDRVSAASATIPFGTRLLFQHEEQPLFVFSRRDLRGPVGADSAVVVCGAGRRDGAAESVRVEHHDRQGRLSPRAGRQPVGAMSRGVSLLGRRPGRVDHRSRLGRPCADLREWQPARASRAASATRRNWFAPRSTSSASRRSGCARPASAQCGASRARAAARVPHGSNSTADSRARAAAARAAATSAFPTCPPIRRGATSAARKSTKSRCRDSSRGCAPPASSAS